MVTWQAVADINPNDQLFNLIKAILLIGDPYHIPGLPGNVDDRGMKTTDGASGIGRAVFPGMKMMPWAQTGKVLDICVLGDMICQQPGANIGPHLTYGPSPQVQNMGAQFLIQKLGGNNGGQ
ncbi:unnamed protein product [Tilletia laevis]|nr:hypothetical protein CF336_g6365 [Tilletia laevis]KAE8190157.1 hypothetical protein CF335_g6433 [Tilletia laevis]CAD6919479.1 unnamed protein product [Tilletia caries]CAD6923893.1 unnamed protein product [Tilletia laevis]